MGETKEIERSVQMRLYALHKRQFVGVFVVFLICLFITILIGLAGPSVIESIDYTSENPSPSLSGPYEIQTKHLDTFHQRLWLTVQTVTNLNDEFRQSLNVTVRVYSSTPSESQTYIRQRTVHCQKQLCNQLILFHLNYLHENRYSFQIQFDGLEQNKDKKIKDFQFFLNTFNPKYTEFELAFRFAFLLSSIVATCFFTKSMRRFSVLDWSLEQRWMVILLVFLVFYNDPFYPITFLSNSSFPVLLDGILQATFLCILLLFWLSVYHGIRQNTRRFVPFYLPKLILVSCLWIFAVALSSTRIVQEFRDPMYNMTIDMTQFTIFRLIFFTVGILYILYLIFLIIRAFGELRNMPYFDVRLKFMTVLMLFVVSASIVITTIRFGSGIIEENFVPELASRFKNSVEFLSYYALINFYLYTMAYVYSPAKNAAIDSLFRDNPTFSMINDSDEDVVYGSDHEAAQLTTIR